MTFRIRIFITLTLLCHLFLVPALLISQLQPESDARTEAPQVQPPTLTYEDVAGNSGAQPAGEQATIKAREQEKQGDVYRLRGDAEIDYRTYVLRADEMTYNAATGDITLTGHVLLNGGSHDEHITATHGTYNINTESGKFYDVVGTTGARARGRGVVLTSSNPFSFTGAEVEKVGRDKFIVRGGRVTSCTLPKPKWSFQAQEVQVIAGENAKMYNSTFRLFGIPVFYFPFVQHPVERLARQSGFLIPRVGNSTIKGFTIGDSFYWAMNRSMDMTAGAEYYSRRGWAQRGDFRWRPSEAAFLNFNYFGLLDRGSPITQTIFVPGVGNSNVNTNPGGQEARLNGEANLPYDFRGVANIDYLSQFLFRVVYAERFNEAINTEVKSVAFLSRTTDGYSFNGMTSRYQNFQSTQTGDVVTIVHAPSGEFSSVDRKLSKSPFYWSFDAASEGLSRRQPSFVTNDVVGRFDVAPNLSMPMRWKGWGFRPEVTLRNTYYSERTVANSSTSLVPVSESINRRAIDAAFEIRPLALAKIFEKPVLGRKLKHTIEPRIRYEKVSGVDNFREIIRFDDRDILANTNEIEYAIVNRLFAKRQPRTDCPAEVEHTQAPTAPARGLAPERTIQPPMDSEDDSATAEESTATAQSSGCGSTSAREIISWELAQKYFFDPTFGGALVPGRRNVFTSTENLTGVAFLFEPRRFSPIVSRLRINKGARTDLDWQIDYDTLRNRINSTIALVSFKLNSNIGVSAGHAYLQTPNEFNAALVAAPQKFNQFRTQLSYGNLNRRGLNAGGVIGYDVSQGQIQYAAAQTTYNWDCCGITFEYRRFKFGSVRDESQYRFALTLANIGTFGTLRKQERLF